MNARLFVFACLFAALLPAAAGAVLPSERLADPALEARAREISQDLRCQVCQNQSIDDSNASLAADLRRIVRERLTAGDSNAAVLSYVTQRYGDYVLLRPPLRTDTILLWYGPSGLLAAGLIGAAIYMRRRSPKAGREIAALSAEEEHRLAKLLAPEARK